MLSQFQNDCTCVLLSRYEPLLTDPIYTTEGYEGAVADPPVNQVNQRLMQENSRGCQADEHNFNRRRKVSCLFLSLVLAKPTASSHTV